MLRLARFLCACLVCAVAVLLPYRARLLYGRALAAAAHLPYLLFGRLARFLLRRLGAEPGLP